MRVMPANQPRPGRQRAAGVAGLGAETEVTVSLPSRCSEPDGDTNSERRRCRVGRDSWQPAKTVEVVVPKLGFTGEWQLTRDAGMAGAKDGGTKPQVLVGDEVGRGQGPEKLL